MEKRKHNMIFDGEPMTYEKRLIEIMIYEKTTLLGALDIDFTYAMLDTDCVFDLTDYLEENLDLDMEKVKFYMELYTGSVPDMELKLP